MEASKRGPRGPKKIEFGNVLSLSLAHLEEKRYAAQSI